MNSPPAQTLPLRLRAATDAAHRSLERALDLLQPPLSRARFTALLGRFWGFHAVWEPALRARADLAALMAGRYRLPLLERDLMALGLSPGEIEALPRCAPAAGLVQTPEGALGSLYVLEGSTLGGRIIGRALQSASWLPPGGLQYFDPYGPETGILWRAFQDRLKTASTPAVDAGVEAGALDTFALLQAWLAPAAGGSRAPG